MTDKEKIRVEIKRLDVNIEKVFLCNDVSFEYMHGYKSSLAMLSKFIDSLQEEPVSDDFEMALAEMIDKAQKSVVEPWVIAAQWKDELVKLAKGEEPVSEELEKATNIYVYENAKEEWSDCDMHNAFVAGAKWQKEQLMAEAVDGKVISNEGLSFPISYEIYRLGLEEGDKVKVIVIKED